MVDYLELIIISIHSIPSEFTGPFNHSGTCPAGDEHTDKSQI